MFVLGAGLLLEHIFAMEVHNLKITTESLGNRQLSLTVEMDEERANRALRRAARWVSKEVNIPGFRRGKAPYSVVVQRYGEDVIIKKIADMLAEEVFKEAVEQEGIEVYAPGELKEVKLHPLTLVFTLHLEPVIDLGHYREYRLPYPEVTVSNEDLWDALEDIREQNALLEPAERPIADGDFIVLDLVGQVDDEIVFEEKESEVLVGAEEIVPGLFDAIVGMEIDEERTFALTLPADFPHEDLRGEEANFTVEVIEVYNRILPELEDDLARTVGKFDTFEELEAEVRGRLLETAQKEADDEYASQVMKDIVSQAQVEYSPILIEKKLDQMVSNFEQSVKNQYHLALEDYLRIQGQTVENLRKGTRSEAEASLKQSLVLGEVVKREGLEVSSEEMEDLVSEISAEQRRSLTDEEVESVHSSMLGNKAVQRLVAIAKGEAPELDVVEEDENNGVAEEIEETGAAA
jgi:trigger factor